LRDEVRGHARLQRVGRRERRRYGVRASAPRCRGARRDLSARRRGPAARGAGRGGPVMLRRALLAALASGAALLAVAPAPATAQSGPTIEHLVVVMEENSTF